MKYLFIANPVAGKGRTKKLLKDIRKYLDSSRIQYKLIETTAPGELLNLINLIQNEYNRIVVIGGDGTIHELINSEVKPEKIYGILPTGSGNDFAFTLGLNKNLMVDLQTIIGKKTAKIDIGYAELEEFSGRKFNFLFANSLGIGFDAEVASYAKRMKILRGLLLYLINVFRVLIVYKYRNLEIKSESLKIKQPIFMVSIGNGKTAGGGFKLTPLAIPNDNLFDICLVKKISKLKVLQILPLAIIGKHIYDSDVIYFKTQELEINSDKPIYVHADGEIKSEQMKSIRIRLLKNYANFISDGVAYVNEKTRT